MLYPWMLPKSCLWLKAMKKENKLADIAGRYHKDVMRSIRLMEPALEKVNGRNFALVENEEYAVFTNFGENPK